MSAPALYLIQGQYSVSGSQVVENLRVPQDQCKFTCREKIYPDGSAEVLICDRPIFGPSGWEPEKGQKKVSHKRDTQPDPANVQRAARRARARLRELALCNDFQVFVTLTLDKREIDRYDPAQVVRKMSTWCDNHVRRDGLRYILVPEHHKDGAIHFHGFMGWDSPETAGKWCRDSGTVSLPGRKKPVKVRSAAHRAKLIAQGGHPVYNLPKWSLGFTTAVELYGDYHQAVTYVCKYVGKEVGDGGAGGKIGGRWFYHGGCHGEPEVYYSNQMVRDFEGYPGAYFFNVPEAGLSFCRIIKEVPNYNVR